MNVSRFMNLAAIFSLDLESQYSVTLQYYTVRAPLAQQSRIQLWKLLETFHNQETFRDYFSTQSCNIRRRRHTECATMPKCTMASHAKYILHMCCNYTSQMTGQTQPKIGISQIYKTKFQFEEVQLKVPLSHNLIHFHILHFFR